MILNTIFFQRRLIRKIYSKSKKNDFKDPVKINFLSSNKKKTLYFLFELERQKLVRLIELPTNEEDPYAHSLLGGLVQISPQLVQLTPKGIQFFPMLIDNYLDIFFKSFLIPVVVSLVTTLITIHLTH